MHQPPFIRRMSKADAIVQHFLARIRSGEFGSGDRLPSERLLQRELGVGRWSLREGLAQLSARGISRIDHGRGAFVQDKASSHSLARAMTPCFSISDQRSMEDLVHARELIEGQQVETACLYGVPIENQLEDGNDQ